MMGGFDDRFASRAIGERELRDEGEWRGNVTADAGYILASPAFPDVMRNLALRFVSIHDAAPRIAALFATQQRWLLCHAAMAAHFRSGADGQNGLTRRGLAQLALQNGIASRNTVHAFVDEALKYDVVRPVAGDAGLRGSERSGSERIVPSPATLSMLALWYVTHLEALDGIDGGMRSAHFGSDAENMLGQIQPLVSAVLLSAPDVRVPGPLPMPMWAAC